MIVEMTKAEMTKAEMTKAEMTKAEVRTRSRHRTTHVTSKGPLTPKLFEVYEPKT